MNEVGVDMAGKLMDYGISYGLNSQNNKWAAEREHMARLENYRFGEMAADSADARTRALYYDLQSPQALLQQYQQAGLSPSMMFGGSGTGGSVPQGAQGNGAAGISPTVFGMNPRDLAEMDFIRAQTAKTREETKTEAGENDRGIAEIANMYAEKGYKEAATSLTRSQEAGQDLSNYINGATKDFQVKEAEYKCEIAANNVQRSAWEVKEIQLQYRFDKETFRARMNAIDLSNEKTTSEILLNKALKAKTDQEKQTLIAQVNRWEEQTRIEYGNLAVRLTEAATQREYNEILKDFQEKQVKYWEDALTQDDEHFQQQYGLSKKQFIYMITDNERRLFLEMFIQILSKGMANRKS